MPVLNAQGKPAYIDLSVVFELAVVLGYLTPCSFQAASSPACVPS
jgi:hypothetical protein